MPIDPATILYALPKSGGREAVLLRRLFTRGAARLEITVASREPSGRYYALRGVGIGPDLLQAFAEAVPAAVDAVSTSGRADGPAAPGGASTAILAAGNGR